MHSPTRRLLTGAALTLLAVACAAALGASKAAAASQHATKAKIHKIGACGYTATASGTYELTKNLTDAGSGSCITLNGDNITLYLDGHTITGSGTDTCVYVEGNSNADILNDTVVGGTKAKPTTTATLTGCEYGLYIYYTSATTASHLKIVAPASEGVYEYYSAATMLSNINVPLQNKTAYGFYMEYGAGNVVAKSTVNNNSTDPSFYIYEETGDTFTHDTAMDSYSTGGNDGKAFEDDYSSRDTYSYDTAKGYYDGFYLYSGGYGPVTATHNIAKASSTYNSGYGFYIYEAYQEADYAAPFHTMIAHNTADGFYYDYYDESSDSYAVAEKWIDNTADNYGEYGFYIYYNTDYTMTGNIADGNTKTKKYDGSSTTYGFYLYYPYSYYPFAKFASNQAYDSKWGFYSDEEAVAGTGNIAKRNKYASYLVQVNG